MAGANARCSRGERLTALEVQFPLWVFDADQPAWPRKLANVLPGSRPAKITGWYAWPWEYGTDLRKVNDELPQNVTQSRASFSRVRHIQHALNQLRYDNNFDSDTFRLIYEAGNGLEERDLSNWIFDPEVEGHINPRRIKRIERKWDKVPIWDPKAGLDLLADPDNIAHVAYGIASRVDNDDELLRATGVDVHSSGSGIRRAQFEFLDNEAGHGYGVVFPEKNQKERGLYLNRGPDFG